MSEQVPSKELDDRYLNQLAISFTEPVERIGCNYHFTKEGMLGLLHNLIAQVRAENEPKTVPADDRHDQGSQCAVTAQDPARASAGAGQPPRECLHCRWPAGTRVEVEYDDGEPGEPGVVVENPEIRVRFDEGGGMEVVFPESRLRRATATKEVRHD